MFNTKQINDLTAIDISELSFSDLRVMTGTFRSETTGSGYHKKRTTRSGCQTEIGDIRDDIWQQLAELLVEQASEGEILKRLIEDVSTYPWMQRESSAKRKHYALELHMSRIFDRPEWVGFIPFNESWRPEVLAAADIIWVTTSCCPKPGRITKQQINGYTTNENRVHCPHCGRFSPFQQVAEESNNG